MLAGCGAEHPAAPRAADASSSASTTTTPSPTANPTANPTPSPSTATAPSTAPAGQLSRFPLALGYPTTNQDDGSPVRVTAKPATNAFGECGRTAWDPRSGTSEVIGAEFRGEAEWFRGRTLVLYPTVRAAQASVDRARDAITTCPRDAGGDSGWTEHTAVDYDSGEQSFGWNDRWWETDLGGFDTGLTVYHVVRVGRAVLLTYDYGEGNGSEQTRRSALAAAEKADAPVVKVMYYL